MNEQVSWIHEELKEERPFRFLRRYFTEQQIDSLVINALMPGLFLIIRIPMLRNWILDGELDGVMFIHYRHKGGKGCAAVACEETGIKIDCLERGLPFLSRWREVEIPAQFTEQFRPFLNNKKALRKKLVSCLSMRSFW